MRQMDRRRWFAGVGSLLLLGWAGGQVQCEPCVPCERYFITVFGSQRHRFVPRYTHSWATAVRVWDRGPGQPLTLEPHTISWMPATLVLRPWRFQPEPGVNLDLHTSIRHALTSGQRISQWGPYECTPLLFGLFLKQKARMDSGQVSYQVIDSIGHDARQGRACNCIHAIADADPEFGRCYYPLIRYGESASAYIVAQLFARNALVCPTTVHPWLNTALGLNGYPMVHRDFFWSGVHSP